MLYQWYKHSASAGNLWYDNMAAFLWRYGFQKWGKDNPRLWMGKAAEQAVYHCLDENLLPPVAEVTAVSIFDKFSEGEVFPEREMAGKIAMNMLSILLEVGGTFERKPKSAKTLDGFRKKINYECDLFNSKIGIIDLKATGKMPWGEKSEPKPRWSHVRQLGLYSNLEGNTPVSILYATPKRCSLYEIPKTDAEIGAKELFSAFEQIEQWDIMFSTPEQAAKLIPLNTEGYQWDDPVELDEARKLWNSALRIEKAME